MRKIKRFAALLLAASMSVSLACVPAFADEAEPEELVVETTLALDKTTLSIAVGETVQLVPTVSDGQEVNWTSLTTSVVGVDEAGNVTGLSEGTATVKATTADGSVSANCRVTVYMAFPSYSLREGDTLELETALTDGMWTSQNSNVAKVDQNGEVTAVGFGRTYITVSAETVNEETGEVEKESQTFSITVGGHVGIDISSWNNEIDWEALKEQGIEFVMIRAGYGWEHTDKKFIENIEGAIAHDMPVGVYFYSYAETVEKAQVEADYCIKLLEPYREYLTLPVAYDLEEYTSMSGEALTNVATVFCSALQDAGYHTMVYANSQFLPKMDLDKLSAMGVDYWYAWYPTVPDLSIVRPIVSKNAKATIWQYSSSCVVQGALASGKTDINVMYMPEYLDIAAPALQVEGKAAGAEIRWGGSTYASGYTVYRITPSGAVQEVGSYDGTVHHCVDESYLAGTGYYVTMEIRDPLDDGYYKSYTSDTVYTESAMYDVRLSAAEGGSVSGGGSFIVGKTATITAVPDEGYEFDGWYDEKGNIVSEDAEYSFVVTYALSLNAVFREIPEITISFEDVSEDAWYAGAVNYVVQNGLFTGTTDTTFAPTKVMDRSMLVTVLYRLAGSPEASNRNKFVDVSKDAWYARAVSWAYNSGIMNGTGEKTFSPTTAVTREQIATILMRYSATMGLEVPESTSGDLSLYLDSGSISSFAKEGMEWAVATQLMQGNDFRLMPKKEATRAECATILMRWLESTEA